MDTFSANSVNLQYWIDRLPDDPEGARDALLEAAYARLRALAAKLLNEDFPALHGQTDDVHHDAWLKLRKALESCRPHSVREFVGLAVLNIRRILLDRVQEFRSEARVRSPFPDAFGSHGGPPEPAQTTLDPARLALWTELHAQIDKLPEPERDVVHMLYYFGWTQQEAADSLGLPLTTVQSRWRAARARLALSSAAIE